MDPKSVENHFGNYTELQETGSGNSVINFQIISREILMQFDDLRK